MIASALDPGSLAPAEPLPSAPPIELGGESRAPAALRTLAWLTVATSSVVMREPAPCDLLFPVLAFFAFFGGSLRLGGQGFAVGGGAFLLVAANLVSVPFGWLEPAGTLRFLGITLYLVASTFVFCGLVARHGEGMARTLLRAYLFAAVLAAVVGILARFGWLPNADAFFLDEEQRRIRSTFKDPNVFAPFLVGAILIALDDWATARRRLAGTLGLLALFVLGIVFAFSRGAILNLVVSLAAYGFLRLFVLGDTRACRRLVGVAFVAGLVLAPLAVRAVTSAGLSGYLAERLSFQDYDVERFGAQRQAFEVAGQNLLGIGPGNWTDPRFRVDTHNTYLRLLVENGILGGIGFGLLVLGVLLRALGGTLARTAVSGVHAVCFAALAGILVESLVIDTLHWRHLFLFLALPVGLASWRRDREPAAEGAPAP